jgi:hypothetical protein
LDPGGTFDIILSRSLLKSSDRIFAASQRKETAMSSPEKSSPKTLEDRVTKLEEDTAKNNKNITDGLQALIDQLEEMKARHCELPPGCEL